MSFVPDSNPRRAAALPFVLWWLILLLLFGISIGVAFLGLGPWAPVIQFTIAAMQTAVLFIFFMRLKGPPSLKWVFAVSGFFWLLFLYGLSMTDYSNRQGWPPKSYVSGSNDELPRKGP